VHTLRSLFMATTVFMIVAAAVPAVADVEVPEEWFGVWETDIAIYDCETNVLVFSTTSRDTTCPGAVFEDPDPGETTFECTSSADANSFVIHCEGSEEVIPGCMANYVYDATTTRNGDSFTSIGTTSFTYTGDCPFIEDSCNRTEVTGTRISNDTADCESLPVEGQPWATVKAYYR
jgi:hypothetical protein